MNVARTEGEENKKKRKEREKCLSVRERERKYRCCNFSNSDLLVSNCRIRP